MGKRKWTRIESYEPGIIRLREAGMQSIPAPKRARGMDAYAYLPRLKMTAFLQFVSVCIVLQLQFQAAVAAESVAPGIRLMGPNVEGDATVGGHALAVFIYGLEPVLIYC